jgi:hypothetical protein
MNYKGIIIEESLSNKSVLDKIKILETKVEQVTEKHKTPWLDKWTLHTVEVDEKDADKLANLISHSIDKNHSHSWYADYRNRIAHYVIFPNKIFKIDINKPEQYQKVKEYGVSLGIPEYQVTFSSEIDV